MSSTAATTGTAKPSSWTSSRPCRAPIRVDNCSGRDNYHTHKHAEITAWLAKPSHHTAFHPDIRILAQPGRSILRIITRQTIRRGSFDSVKDYYRNPRVHRRRSPTHSSAQPRKSLGPLAFPAPPLVSSRERRRGAPTATCLASQACVPHCVTNWPFSGHSRWDLVTKYGKSQEDNKKKIIIIMSVLKMGVISRRAELHRCRPSHAMSSEFCLKFVSFFTIGLADAHIQPSGFPPPVTADHPLFRHCAKEDRENALKKDEPRNLLYRNAPH